MFTQQEVPLKPLETQLEIVRMHIISKLSVSLSIYKRLSENKSSQILKNLVQKTLIWGRFYFSRLCGLGRSRFD